MNRDNAAGGTLDELRDLIGKRDERVVGVRHGKISIQSAVSKCGCLLCVDRALTLRLARNLSG
jgi:hypothetical protein